MSRAGEVVIWAGDRLPENALWCNGKAYSTDDYAQLFAVIGHHYGGDAATFHVPDLRGRMIVGAGEADSLSARNLNDSGGEERVQLTAKEMPRHDHGEVTKIDPAEINNGRGGRFTVARPHRDQTIQTGNDQPHENMPPFRALNFIIFYA